MNRPFALTLVSLSYNNELSQLDYTNDTPQIVDSLINNCYEVILQCLFEATCPNAKFNTLNAIFRIRQCFNYSNDNAYCISLQQLFE